MLTLFFFYCTYYTYVLSGDILQSSIFAMPIGNVFLVETGDHAFQGLPCVHNDTYLPSALQRTVPSGFVWRSTESTRPVNTLYVFSSSTISPISKRWDNSIIIQEYYSLKSISVFKSVIIGFASFILNIHKGSTVPLGTELFTVRLPEVAWCTTCCDLCQDGFTSIFPHSQLFYTFYVLCHHGHIRQRFL